MQGTYLLSAVIIGAFILWPQETTAVLTSVSLKIQVYFLNLRMKWTAWRMYKQLTKMCEDAGFPAPGPFKYVNLWDRDPLD